MKIEIKTLGDGGMSGLICQTATVLGALLQELDDNKDGISQEQAGALAEQLGVSTETVFAVAQYLLTLIASPSTKRLMTLAWLEDGGSFKMIMKDANEQYYIRYPDGFFVGISVEEAMEICEEVQRRNTI